MKFFRKKRTFAVLFIIFLLVLFYNSTWLGKLLYPIRFEKDIAASAQNYGVDPVLLAAIIRVESNFNPKLISKKGAVGLMQLMPETASWIVEQAGYAAETLNMLHRADVNIEIGAWYLKSLHRQFDNNTIVVLAAYNAGPGNAKKWLETNVWDGTLEHVGQIPFGETRHYIQRVVYYYKKYDWLYGDVLKTS